MNVFKQLCNNNDQTQGFAKLFKPLILTNF